GGRVRPGHHVRFLDPAEPLDRGPVESHALGERALQLLRGDGKGLQEAEDVREPETDEADVPFFHGAQDVFGFVREGHGCEGSGRRGPYRYADVKSVMASAAGGDRRSRSLAVQLHWAGVGGIPSALNLP